MKKFLLPFVSFLFVLFATTSCKKIINNATTNPVPPTPAITAPGAYYGTLTSIRTYFEFDPNKFSPVKLPVALPMMNIDLETAVASFSTTTSSTTLTDAGAVDVNTFSLTKADNNAYYRNGFSPTSPTNVDLNFSSGSNWNVAGSSSVTAFTYNHNVAFPSYGGLATLPTTVTKSSNLSLNISSSNADSIYVAILSGSSTSTGTVIKRYGGTATNIVINSSDLSALTTTGSDGIAYLEVIPWRYNTATLNSKDYVFMKLAAYVKNIEIE